jgi:hypothetical protein
LTVDIVGAAGSIAISAIRGPPLFDELAALAAYPATLVQMLGR